MASLECLTQHSALEKMLCVPVAALGLLDPASELTMHSRRHLTQQADASVVLQRCFADTQHLTTQQIVALHHNHKTPTLEVMASPNCPSVVRRVGCGRWTSGIGRHRKVS